MMGSMIPTICSETVVIISVMFLQHRAEGRWVIRPGRVREP
jgi:hypothetical protein